MNALFSSLYDKVVTSSNRPHLKAEITEAIKWGTRYLHSSNLFPRDLHVYHVKFSSPKVGEVQVPLDKLPRFRRVKQVTAMINCCAVHFEHVTDTSKCRHSHNWWRVTGNYLTIKASPCAEELQITSYRMPDVNPDSYESWIADVYPDMVVDAALYNLYRTIRDTAQANSFGEILGIVDSRRTTTHLSVLGAENIEDYFNN